MQPEVRARRLVVTDEHGATRIVAQVVAGGAEIRLQLPDDEQDAHVLLYATPAGDDGLGPDLGVQLWADSDASAEVNLSRVNDRWVAETHTLPDLDAGATDNGPLGARARDSRLTGRLAIAGHTHGGTRTPNVAEPHHQFRLIVCQKL